MRTLQQILEDGAPTTSAGGGAVAGIGVGPQGEPGRPIKRDKFAGHEVFEVDSDTFHKCRFGKKKYKHWLKYVGEDTLGHTIRDYGRKNPRRPIVIKDSRTGSMMFLRYEKLHNY